MKRLAVILFVLAMFACGGSDTGEPGAADEAAPGGEMVRVPDTPEPAGTAASERETSGAPAKTTPSSEAMEQTAESCLGLVGKGQFQQAVPVCTAALKMNPGNQEVEKALDEARAQAAEAASHSAGRAAAEQAGSKLGEAAGGMAADSDD